MSGKNTDAQVYDLEKIRFIIRDAVQLDLSYAYDDLVFSEHGLFIIQFDKADDKKLYCWFGMETTKTFRDVSFESLQLTCKLNKIMLERKGLFEVKNNESSEQVDIHFMPDEDAVQK